MGIKAGNLPTSTIDNTDYLLITEGEAPKRVAYSDVKNDLLGTETLTTAAQTVKGAINEIDLDIGDKTTLTTTNKTSLVNAINENVTSLSDIKKYPCVRVRNSASQSIPNMAWTSLAFDTEDFDTDNIHDNSTSNTRLTCKTAGKYQINALVSFAANVTGYRSLRTLLNGTTTLGSSATLVGNTGSGVDTPYNNCYQLNVGDYIELQAYQTSGGALSTVVSGVSTPTFSMVKVG